MIYYRIVSKEILAEGLTEEDAFIALDMYKDQGIQDVSIEKYDILPRLGRDPDLH